MSYQIIIPKPVQKQLDNISQIERDRLIMTFHSLADEPCPSLDVGEVAAKTSNHQGDRIC